MQASIIIADDHPLVLKGLQDFLLEKNYNVIGNATDGKSALDLIITNKPDIAVLDIRMPHMTGLEIAEYCKCHQIKTKIILITFEKDQATFDQAQSTDVFGYILKEFALVDIEYCLKSVNDNVPYFSPKLMDYLSEGEFEIPESIKLLTRTEKKILRAIAQNKTAKEIGDQFCISSRTVEKHKSHIIKKLKLESKSSSLFFFATENRAFLD